MEQGRGTRQPGPPRRTSFAGLGAAFLLGPHLIFGAWLLAVPDYTAFLTTQIVTLAHVGLALLVLPVVLVWIVRHVRPMVEKRRARSLAGTVSEWLLLAVALVAFVSGFLVLRSGDLGTSDKVHTVVGIGIAIPLAWHLWLSKRRGPALATVAVLVVAVVGSVLARRYLPPGDAKPVSPEFAYQTRSASLYEPSADCGECHVQDYADWRRSTHARSLELANVKDAVRLSSELNQLNLVDIGGIVNGRRPANAALAFGACRSCHSPIGFYGDDRQPMLNATGTLAEGTSCAFCHTLREVKGRLGDKKLPPFAKESFDIYAVMSQAPFYVSAPETVRRYLGQGSGNPLSHQIANWLIRWRPEVHRADYHSKVLDSSLACYGCHSLGVDDPHVPHLTYLSWEKSSFNTHDPATTTTCQDCHMTRHMTGEPVRDPYRFVPWGPVHANGRSHLFLGGNARETAELKDDDLSILEHEFNTHAATLRITHAEQAQDMLNVTVAVRTDLVGHTFPALETEVRYAWVTITALDADGKKITWTRPPKGYADFGSESPLIMASTDDFKPDTQRLIEAKSTREFVGHLHIPSGAKVAQVQAELSESTDPKPFASTTAPVVLASSAP